MAALLRGMGEHHTILGTFSTPEDAKEAHQAIERFLNLHYLKGDIPTLVVTPEEAA